MSESEPQPDRQRIVRVAGGRRVRLTPAPGTSAEPVAADASDAGQAGGPPASTPGPNDERLRRDVPPHY
ncbi:hypothetical protein ACQ143_04595 [Microbacterium sp. MC2]